jgi:hypothetical protein
VSRLAGCETLIHVSEEAPNTPTVEPTLIAPLISEAAKKSAIVWVAIGEQPARCVWHVSNDDGVYVLVDGGSGDSGEQVVPGLAAAQQATVIARSKDKGSRIASWVSDVSKVDAGSEEWAGVLPLLQAARLNGPDYAAAPERWAKHCDLVRLKPTGEVLEHPGEMSSASHAAPPVDSPATTRVPVPFTVHRKPRRRRHVD